ncbi:uncharacterized protein LOC130664778 isoform X1 [Microplitis mediator]|uniref:uncharacterized protein LOC130664778 isoform X1 n=2 Tax=Microplitis mediator TaxID=375433 RepID=UPI002555AA13|nr:uncharacterized protein LOC130664778 isoform X1 [Microplitis mediator]
MSDIQDKSIGEDVGDKIIEDGSLVSVENSSEAPDNNEESSSIHQLSAETMRSLNEEIARTLDLTGTGTGTATGSTTTATGTTTGTSTTTTTQDETGDLSTQPKRDEVQVGKTVAGECRNILPVLVEHLRSALELTSASTKRIIADEPLAPDPLSCNRNYHYQDPTSNSSLSQTHTMDFNFFGDLLVSDIKTALVRLQETLRRVDVDALTRYSSTLESNEKLRLLQLISNLVSNLKMAKLDDVSSVQPQPQPQQLQVPAVSTANSSVSSPAKRRHRGKDRHTIGVSSEELARARRWLEERGTGVTLTSQRLSLAPQTVQLDPSPVNPESNLENKLFDSPRACDKHMKDAINQQQSLQSRTKDTEAQVNAVEPSDTKVSSDKLETDTEQVNFININNKVASNKFTAKKFKIKRANTIDIPNYLKLQAEKSQSCSPGLRRPIDIGDRLSWNPPQANVLIPSFEPKTENDRKFLALINRNNDNNNNNINNNSNSNNSYGNNSTSGFNQPFKSFNYRQTSSIADKNWKSRFSNIKTAFDKPSPPASVDGSSRRSSRDDGKNNYREHPGVLVGSLKLGRPESANAAIKDYNFGRKVGNFTHAATSPFQKINNIKNIYSEEKPTPSYYLPACASSGMLRAKLKMFDHQQETVSPVTTMHVDPLPRVQLSAAHTKVNVKPEKIIKDTGYSTDALNHCQNKIRNNGFRNLSYDKVRRHTVIYDTNGNDDNNNNNNNNNININRINNNDNDRKVQGQDVQKQSVAVQTNYPIQLNNQHVENDDHESLIGNICPRPHQQKNYQSVPITFYENENPIYEPPKPVPRDIDFLIPPIINSNYNSNRFVDDESDHSFMDDENIANQDISDDRIVTRYTSAIATVENSPLSPITPASVSPPDYQEAIPCAAIQPVLSDDVQRHNMLQQSLIRRLHYETDKVIKPIQIPSQAPIPIPIPTATVTQNKSMSQSLSFNKNPRYSMIHYDDNLSPITTEVVQNGRESVEPLIESRNTQEKINIFEEKSTRRPDPLVIRPIHIPPKINIVSPSRTMPQGLNPNNNPYVPPLPVKYSSPVDSSDEYLVNCATRPHRSIVLSKSESWHQLALSKNHLQVPPVPPHKPPRVSSCKHLDPEKNDMKKMEEKVQRYFDRSNSSLGQSKRDSGPKRRSLPRKNNLGSLARSHTMPHIYDDVTDVDKAFDSLFEETTRDRH